MKNAKNELLQFLAGLAMLVAGLFIFSQKVVVYTSFWGGLSFGGMRMTSGLIIVPLIIGIVWMFASGASLPSKIMTGLGVLLIIVAVIVSTSIRLTTMSLYEWLIILVLIFGGAALDAKVLLSGGNSDEEDKQDGYRARKNNRKRSREERSHSPSYSAIDVEKELEGMKKTREDK